jgi:glycosyltransferase involved in cell wall biosynthesis
MPRVLLVLNRLVIGGPAVVAVSLAKYLRPEFETMLVVGGRDDHEQDATHLTAELGIEPVVIPEMKRAVNWKNDRAAYKKMKSLIRDFKPDIVHTHAAKSGAIGRLAAASMKVPVIVHTFHGHVFHSYFGKLKTKFFIAIERFLAKRSSGIIAISEKQRAELADEFHICPKRLISVIPLGLDLDKLETAQEEKRNKFRKEFFVQENEIAIGIVGRIVPVKNHSLFIQAAAIALKSTDKKLRFFIIGDGDMRETIEAEIKASGIDYAYFPDEKREATITCTSWQTEMDIVFAGLDIIALTSHNEGTPVALMEAQAASRPFVSTNVGGIRDIVKDGETGYLVAAGDSSGFAAAIVQLATNTSLRESMGQQGAVFAKENFSMKGMIKNTADYYKQLLSQRR